jgi:signal transduction histidine kinase
LTAQLRIRLQNHQVALVAFSIALYSLGFAAFHRIGLAATEFVLLPVAAIGWFYGARYGVLAGVSLSVLQALCGSWLGVDQGAVFSYGWMGLISACMVGLASGLMRARFHLLDKQTQALVAESAALQQQVAEREMAEQALQQARSELEQRVLERTSQLARANEVLAAEVAERKRMENAERSQRLYAEALRDTIAAVASTLDFEEVLDRILERLSHVAEHDGSTIVLLDGDLARVARVRGYGTEHPGFQASGMTFAVGDLYNFRWMLENDRPIAVSDTRVDPNWVRLSSGAWIASYASAPIHARGQVIGFLNLESATPGALTQAASERLQTFADQTGVAIENARLYKTVRGHASDMEARVAERTAELVAANESLRQSAERLKELDILKNHFVSNVSHELRTPLANIKLYLSLLENGKPHKLQQYMATLKRETELLCSLIEDLLQLSRLDLGKITVTLGSLDVNRVVADLAHDREALVAQHGLSLSLSLADDLPLARADARLLTQVLTNLISNAMLYTRPGGCITVSTQTCFGGPDEDSDGQQWVLLTVQDSGVGISTYDLAHLFERFYRGQAARLTNAPGTGLGLAISQQLVTQHDGKLTVKSVEGQGSEFSVWLPLA